MMPDIELDIDELVLHGFAPGDGDQIGAAIRRELARLFAEQGLPAGLGTGGAVPRLDGGGFQVAAGATTKASVSSGPGPAWAPRSWGKESETGPSCQPESTRSPASGWWQSATRSRATSPR